MKKAGLYLASGVLIILYIVVSTYVHNKGKQFYAERELAGKTRAKVYDIGTDNIPDMSSYQTLETVIGLVTMIIPYLFGAKVLYEYVGMFITIALIRCLFIPLTILPKEKSCDDSELSVKNYMFGHCYDKIFSGHFASAVLLALVLYGRGLVRPSILAIGCMMYAFFIIALRYHYTADLAVGALVALVVYQNKLNFFSLF